MLVVISTFDMNSSPEDEMTSLNLMYTYVAAAFNFCSLWNVPGFWEDIGGWSTPTGSAFDMLKACSHLMKAKVNA